MDTTEILKKIRTLEIKTRGLVETAFAGDYHSVFKGRGMNFEDVREYQPGDEIRSIDWNVTARMGTAFVKKFTEERELTVMLVVDVSASGNFGSTTQSKRELAAEVACLLAFSAIRNNDKVGLILFTDRVELFIPPKKGRSHTLRLIREILFFQPQGRGTDPVLALDYLNKIVTRRAVVFFISDFQTPDFSRALAVSGQRHDFVAIHIHDEREKLLPNIGIIMLEDAETGEQLEINTSERGTRTRFAQLADERAAELARILRRNNIDAISLKTNEDYLPALRKLPGDIALEELERISREIERMSPYLFSIRVSDILRKYVTQQHGLPATRQTSIEFLTALAKAASFSSEEKSLLEDFLNRCDLIKFARYEATTSDSELLL